MLVQEDRSGWKNIRVEGVVDSVKRSWDKTERAWLQQLFQGHLGLNDIYLERTHIVQKSDKFRDVPNTIVSKLLHDKDKEIFTQNVLCEKGSMLWLSMTKYLWAIFELVDKLQNALPQLTLLHLSLNSDYDHKHGDFWKCGFYSHEHNNDV